MHKILRRNIGIVLAAFGGVAFSVAGSAAFAAGFLASDRPLCSSGDIVLNALGEISCAGDSGAMPTSVCVAGQDLIIDASGKVACRGIVVAPVCQLTQIKGVATNEYSVKATCVPSAESFTWTPLAFDSPNLGEWLVTATPVQPVTFVVTGSNSGGASTPVSITVPESTALPVCSVRASASQVTAGATVALTATCNPAAKSYEWSSSIGTITSTSNPVTVAVASQTSYAVKGVTATGLKGVLSAQVVVAVSGAPASAAPTCTLSAEAGQFNQVYLSSNCTPAATSFRWGGTGAAIASGAFAGYVDQPQVRTTYTVQGVNSRGAGNIANVVVDGTVATTKPVCTARTSSAQVEAGSSVTLTADCTPSATSYSWKRDAVTVGSGNPFVFTPSLDTVPGVYTHAVIGTNSVGSSDVSVVNVTVFTPPPSCKLTVSPAVVGANEPVLLTAVCTGTDSNKSYTWIGSDSQNPLETINATRQVNPGSTTTYSVTGYVGSDANRILIAKSPDASVVVKAPVCTLSASPAAMGIDGGVATLTATCTPAASDAAHVAWRTTAPSADLSAPATLFSINSISNTAVYKKSVTFGAAAEGSYGIFVTATNGSGAGGEGVGAPMVISTAPVSMCGTNILSGQLITNQNVLLNWETAGGKNFNQTLNRGQSISYEFTSPSVENHPNWNGSVYWDLSNSFGIIAAKKVTISRSQCDFRGELPEQCAIHDGTPNKMAYAVRPAGSSQIASTCMLLPSTKYFVNIRNESKIVPNADSCAVGTKCGFLFQIH